MERQEKKPKKIGGKEKRSIGKRKYQGTYGWIAVAVGKGLGMGGLIAWLFFRSPLGLVCMPVCVAVAVVQGKKQVRRKEKETEQQYFVEYLGFLKEALQVGYSLERAVEEAKKGMLTTGKEEDSFLRAVTRMQRKMQLGLPVEAAFSEWAKEAVCEDIRDFSEVLFIAKRTGGAVQQVITNTEQVIRDKQETMRYIQSVLHSKEYEAKVMKLMPFAMLLYMQMFLPGFLEPLYHNVMGVCVMSAVLVIYFVLSVVVDKVTAVSV